MKQIILAGGRGFLGRALSNHYLKLGYEVVVLASSPKNRKDGAREVGWDVEHLGD